MDFVSIDVSRVVAVLSVTVAALIALRIVEVIAKRRVVVRTRQMLARAGSRRGDSAKN